MRAATPFEALRLMDVSNVQWIMLVMVVSISQPCRTWPPRQGRLQLRFVARLLSMRT